MTGEDYRAAYEAALKAPGSSGFYNKNVRIDTASGPVIVRIPLHEADEVDLRIWPEHEVLSIIAPYVTHAPRLLHVSESPAYQVHEFIPGLVVDDVASRGDRVPPVVLDAVVELFSELARVPRDAVPGLPQTWPTDGDTSAFANVLSDTTQRVYDAFVDEFAWLFAELGIPADPLAAARARWPAMTARPFRLVHSDVHRKNMIVDGARTIFLDWELALWGDPLYELAVHFHKMAYQDDEQEAVLGRWLVAMTPELTRGWERDLDAYLAHERVKSAIVDTIRYRQLISSGELTPAEEQDLIDKLHAKHAAATAVWGIPKPVSRETIEKSVRRD
ncbi:aminoglycoside phosphotransferase family protein [Microbispora sp. H10670]|uniref:aminoglycoside phosphotransferase family protein n=1 Tax=Microbispora sp. H10670 TaxID=2729108 RepID=UPI0016043541|nr:aminoglycoside phosphotransferase family protein [Microbispora sp. H10670]